MSELFPACFSCSKSFYLAHSSLDISGKNSKQIRKAMIAGYLSSIIRGLSLVLLFLKAFSSNYISFAKSFFTFLSDKIARSIL